MIFKTLTYGKVFLILLTLAAYVRQPSEEKDEKTTAKRLNVLFIVSDDLRTELGAYGYSQMKTPNIDQLAAEGRVFTQAHVQEAICNPSRMSFLTGLRPDVTQVYTNRDHFDRECLRPLLFRNTSKRMATARKL